MATAIAPCSTERRPSFNSDGLCRYSRPAIQRSPQSAGRPLSDGSWIIARQGAACFKIRLVRHGVRQSGQEPLFRLRLLALNDGEIARVIGRDIPHRAIASDDRDAPDACSADEVTVARILMAGVDHDLGRSSAIRWWIGTTFAAVARTASLNHLSAGSAPR